jgi:hypothetical protein
MSGEQYSVPARGKVFILHLGHLGLGLLITALSRNLRCAGKKQDK